MKFESLNRKIRAEAIKALDALQTVPTFTFTLIRHGILPTVPSFVRTVGSEPLTKVPQVELGKFLARVLGNSGPVMIKLGQILATRNDILPKIVCLELERLYDTQPAMPRRQLERILEAKYGSKLPFRLTNKKPLGVGSIGEVHRAVLDDKTKVVVKVIRPGILRKIRRDVHFIETVLDVINFRFSLWNKDIEFTLRRALSDLASSLESEADLRVEAKSLRDFRKRFRNNPNVYVPYCYERHSGKNILVMEELEGEPLAKAKKRAEKNPKLAKKLASLALTEILKQIFEDGHFHADPHGGNLLLLPDGRLGIIDLGLTGTFGPRERKIMVQAIRAMFARDADRVIKALLQFGELPPNFNKNKFAADIKKIVRAHKTAAGEARLENLVNELFTAAYKHQIYVPKNSILLVKTLVTVEGLARSIDPDINLVEKVAPIVLRAMLPTWLRWSTNISWKNPVSKA